jgi:hypothetical protein
MQNLEWVGWQAVVLFCPSPVQMRHFWKSHQRSLRRWLLHLGSLVFTSLFCGQPGQNITPNEIAAAAFVSASQPTFSVGSDDCRK